MVQNPLFLNSWSFSIWYTLCGIRDIFAAYRETDFYFSKSSFEGKKLKTFNFLSNFVLYLQYILIVAFLNHLRTNPLFCLYDHTKSFDFSSWHSRTNSFTFYQYGVFFCRSFFTYNFGVCRFHCFILINFTSKIQPFHCSLLTENVFIYLQHSTVHVLTVMGISNMWGYITAYVFYVIFYFLHFFLYFFALVNAFFYYNMLQCSPELMYNTAYT